MSVGFTAVALIFSAVAATGTSVASAVGAGNGTSKQVNTISDLSDTLQGVQEMLGGSSVDYDAKLYDEEVGAEGSNPITSFTYTQSSGGGLTETVSYSSQSMSMTLKYSVNATMAMTQKAFYYSYDSMVLTTTSADADSTSTSTSMQSDIAAEMYIPFDGEAAYMKIGEYSIFYNGNSYFVPEEIKNVWIKLDDDSISINLGYTNSYALAFDTIVNYVTSDSTIFTKNGYEYYMNDDSFDALMNSIYGASELKTLGGTIDGDFSVDLANKTAPEMKLKYNCNLSTSESGYSIFASGNEKDTLCLKNVNNTVINITESELAANAITEEVVEEYWSTVEWPI